MTSCIERLFGIFSGEFRFLFSACENKVLTNDSAGAKVQVVNGDVEDEGELVGFGIFAPHDLAAANVKRVANFAILDRV